MQHPDASLTVEVAAHATGSSVPDRAAVIAQPSAGEWADSQAQMLLDTWLLTLFAVLLGTALPWFFNSLEIDFAAASWVLLLLGADYVAMAALSSVRERRPVLGRRALTLLHVLGIIGIGLVWQRCGGLQNPMFLLVFVLPVIGGSALSRWQPYLSALLAVLVALAVALAQTPELRWYAGGLDAISQWLTGLLGGADAAAEASSAFPGFYAPVGYDLVLLEVFAILLFFCAISAESIGDVFHKVIEHLHAARADERRSQELWSTLMRQLPLPALLVDAETLQILLTSTQLGPFWPADAQLGGQGLLEAVRCSYPERLQQLVAGEGGVVTPVIVHAAEELRVATVRVQHLIYDGPRLALVLMEDTTDTFHLRAALDAEEHATLVISARGRVVATNQAARALFPEVRVGSDASRVLSRPTGVPHWWEPGLTGRRRMHVTLLRRTFLTTCTAVALPGEEEALFVLTFALLLPATGTADKAVSATP